MNLSTENTKKALDCCVNKSNCQECPLYEEHAASCLETACKNALDYINNLEHENKSLQTENVHLQGEIRQLTADKSNLLDICMIEKAKVGKLRNIFVENARKLQITTRLFAKMWDEANSSFSFNGVIRINPRSIFVPSVVLETEWIYNPQKKIYIANGIEYSEDICEIVMIDRSE